MEFGEKLSKLRKQRGMTQEELASSLFVSRAAISKWESGRGYPGIDSLKALAKFFGVSIDTLLSGDEVLCLAQEENRKSRQRSLQRIFGLLDLSAVMFFFLPLLRQQMSGEVQAVSLLSLRDAAPLLRAAYFAAVISIVAAGAVSLALQDCEHPLWQRSRIAVSFLPQMLAALLFILGLHPYAAALALILLTIKALLLIKQR